MTPNARRAPLLAILFWYYKEPEVCADRLRMLRCLNPQTPIFGLYGGEPDEFDSFDGLASWMDDSWCFPGRREPLWKWRHGDLMINEWFARRGRSLVWDSIVIMQWDLVAFVPLEQVFKPLYMDEIFLPGLRPLSEVADTWHWVRPGTPEGEVFQNFAITFRRQSTSELMACLFVMAIFPRRFLELYGSLEEPESGFLEYKLPTYARHFGFSMRDYPNLPRVWRDQRALNAKPFLSAEQEPIPSKSILFELLSVKGVRLFHPVMRAYNFGIFSLAKASLVELILAWRVWVRRTLAKLLARSPDYIER